MQEPFKSRIAPTPSGYLHLGNAFNFLLTTLLIDLEKGHLHLRIDDFDNSRLNKKSVEDIFVQLEWLGIEYDSGPSGPDELFSKYSQKLKNDYYFSAIEILKRKKHIFACECSRLKIKQLSSKNKYPGICRFKGIDFKTKNVPWRMHVPNGTNIKYKTFFNSLRKIEVDREIGDFIIKRRDGLPAYQIVSLLEDLEAGVNLIVRGQDLIASTGAQLFIAQCLNEKKFLDSKFVHHKLIKNNSGEKLSKSFGDLSLKVIKEKIKTPKFIYQEIAKMLNLNFNEIVTLDHLKHSFKISITQKNILKF
tara:strand:- start:105 stop:1019 length:915 start_codon:yes stop_codon:yes gene_type:complete